MIPSDERIVTERLTLRPWTAQDLKAFHAIWGDPEVIWWGASESLDDTRSGYERLLARHDTWPSGIGWYAMVENETHAVVGDVLLQPAPFVEGIEIGWHLCRHAWGRGYATEAARAVRDRAFEATDLQRIYAIVAIQNPGSLRVVEKLGMEALRDMEHAGLPHRLFAIDRPGG